MFIRFIQSLAIVTNLILCGVVAQGFSIVLAIAMALTLCMGLVGPLTVEKK